MGVNKITPGDAGQVAGELASPMTADDLMPVRDFLRIVHHVPGRLRVRLSKNALRAKVDMSLGDFLRFVEDACGARVSISKPTLSAVVEYDPERLSPSLWDSLIDGPEEAARSAFVALTKPA